MKLLSFGTGAEPSWGALDTNDRIVDLRRCGESVIPTLRDALASIGLDGIRERLAAQDRSVSRRLDEVLSTDESLRREIKRLKGSQEQHEQERASHLEAVRLLRWKSNLAGSLQALLIDRQGAGWHAELRRSFGEQFEAIAQEAVASFYAQADRHEQELRAALAEAQAAYGLTREEHDRLRTDLERRREVVLQGADRLAPR